MNWSKISGNCFSWRSPLWRFRILWARWRLWLINSWSQGSWSLWRGSLLALDGNWGSFTDISTRFLMAGDSSRDLVILQCLCGGVRWLNLVLYWRRSLSCCSCHLYWCLLVIRLVLELYWWAPFSTISRIFGLLSRLLSLRNFFWGLWLFLSGGRFFAALLSLLSLFVWWAFSWRLALLLRNLALVVGCEILLILREIILFFLHFILLLWVHSWHDKWIELLWVLNLLWNILLCLQLSHLV